MTLPTPSRVLHCAARPAAVPEGRPGEAFANARKPVFYRPELDILRFAAFFLVFLHHAMPAGARLARFAGRGAAARLLEGLFLGGGYGVDLFFCLSAYLITTLLLKEKMHTGAVDVKSFYIRRILRIWPLYFVFLLCAMPAASLIIPEERLPSAYWGPFLLLSGNWACAGWGFPPSPASVLWSVSIEEQFYLTWPLVMRRWIGRLPLICAGLIVTAFASRAALVYWGRDGGAALFCNTLTRLDPIAAGALIGWRLRGRVPNLAPKSRLLLLSLGTAGIVACGAAGARSGAAAFWTYPAAAAASVLLLLGSLGADVQALPALLRRALVKAGQVSYGLYVFHAVALAVVAKLMHASHSTLGFGMFLVQTVLTLLLTFALALASYECVEAPFLRLKRKFTHVGAGR